MSKANTKYMKLDTIYEEWEKDAHIDITNLSGESLRIPKLHATWHKKYVMEKLKLKKLEADLKVLKHDKDQFYLCGPSKEQVDAGWQLPPRGKILKSDVESWVESDRDVIDLTLKIAMQQAIVETLKEFVQGLQSSGYSARSQIIKNAIEVIKFQSGG